MFDEEGLRFRIATGLLGGTTKLRRFAARVACSMSTCFWSIPRRSRHGMSISCGARTRWRVPRWPICRQRSRLKWVATILMRGSIVRDIASRSPGPSVGVPSGGRCPGEVNGQADRAFVSDLRDATAAPHPRWVSESPPGRSNFLAIDIRMTSERNSV